MATLFLFLAPVVVFQEGREEIWQAKKFQEALQVAADALGLLVSQLFMRDQSELEARAHKALRALAVQIQEEGARTVPVIEDGAAERFKKLYPAFESLGLADRDRDSFFEPESTSSTLSLEDKIEEYSNAVAVHGGPMSKEAKSLRERWAEDQEFQRIAIGIDRLHETVLNQR